MFKAAITLFTLLFSFQLAAAGSGPSMASFGNKLSKTERIYNQGVELMLDKKFKKAERKFRQAIERDEEWAEAHNNLAYTLRKQGSNRFYTSLLHYNTAIELDPSLTEAYMYRGVLHVQMGNLDRATNDLEVLRKMNSPLVDELSYVINTGQEKTPEQFFGVSAEVNN